MANPSLTAYSSTADGLVRNHGSGSWSSLQSAATGTDAFTSQSAAASLCMADGTTADKYIDRSFYYFDLSSIPTGADIVSATFQPYVSAKSSGAGGSVYVVEGTQAATLTTADFDSCGSTSFVASPTNFASLTAGAYNTFTLNATGLAYIKSKFGSEAKLCLRSSFDLNNSAPGTTVWSSMDGYFSDRTGTGEDPKLVVTYSLDRSTTDSWAWSDSAQGRRTDSAGQRFTYEGGWAWSDTAVPYRRAIAEVVVWAEGNNTTLSGAHNPVGATITVASTTGFASSGTIWIYDGNDNYSQARATYTGKTSTTFTGCSWTSVLGDLNFADGVGVSAVDAETHFPQVVAVDDPATTSIPELVVTAKQGAGHGTLNGTLVMKRSTDGGMTWGAQSTIQTAVGSGASPPRGIFGHTLIRLKNGRLLVMWYEHDLGYATTPGSTGPLYNYLSYSDDRGVTWSTPVLMDLNFGFSNRDGYTGFSSILYTGSGSNSTYGDVYIPVTGNKDGITVHTSGESYRWETWLYKITDGGASGTATKVAEAMKYTDVGRAAGEAAVVIAENGDWIMQARIEPTTGTPDFSDAEKRNRWQTRSTDTGATWGTPAKVIDSFANGAVLVKLPGGTLISTGSPVKTTSPADTWAGQTGSVPSHDNGTTWTRAIKWEATNGTYAIYNGSDYEVVVNDAAVQVNTAFTYSQERSNQLGARTLFRWYVDPVKRSSDAWAWSDAATRATNIGKTTGDAWAWSDTATRTTTRAVGSSDSWAWTDTVTTAIAKGASDAWAWSDTATRSVLAFARSASDAWTWSESAVGSVGPQYELWSWNDIATVTTSITGAAGQTGLSVTSLLGASVTVDGVVDASVTLTTVV